MPLGKATKILLGSGAGLAAAGAGGAGGYFLGKRQGGEQMAGVMANKFMVANQAENKALARHYFRKGLSYNPAMSKESSMDKTATLEEIRNDAFNDELDKLAAIPGMGRIVQGLKSVGTSAKALYQHSRQAGSGLRNMYKGRKGPENMRKLYAASAKESAGKAMTEGGLALGIVGAGLAGAGAGVGSREPARFNGNGPRSAVIAARPV